MMIARKLRRPSKGRPVLAIDPAMLMDGTFVTTRELAGWIGKSVVTVERWRALGKGPRHIVTGDGGVLYAVGAVRSWLAPRQLLRGVRP